MQIQVKPKVILCQSCIERQISPANIAKLQYQGLPICEDCLNPLLDNVIDRQEVQLAKEVSEDRLANALLQFDGLAQISDNWALTREETLTSHEDFYNYNAPAIINLSLQELETLINRRQSILFATKKHIERIQETIDKIKAKEREEKKVRGIEKSLSEVSKKPSSVKSDQQAKLAKAMGISLEQLKAIGAQARQAEFGDLLQGKVQSTINQPVGIREILQTVKQDSKTSEVKTSSVGKRCNECKKFTCICKR